MTGTPSGSRKGKSRLKLACQGGADNIDRWPDIALANSLVSSSHDGVGAQSDVGRFAVEAYPLYAQDVELPADVALTRRVRPCPPRPSP